MSTAARPLAPPVSLPDPSDPVAALRRDLASLRVSNAALRRALVDRGPATRIAVVRGDAFLAPGLRVAQLLEEQGRVPVVRWARDVHGQISGVELAVVQTDEERSASLPPALDMDCVGDDDATGFYGRLEAVL